MEWISVKDRSPNLLDRVLVCVSGFDDDEDYVGINCALEIREGVIEWNIDFSVLTDCKTQVTHWMPLPETPKDG